MLSKNFNLMVRTLSLFSLCHLDDEASMFSFVDCRMEIEWNRFHYLVKVLIYFKPCCQLICNLNFPCKMSCSWDA